MYYYCLVDFLALMVLLITNYDILLHYTNMPSKTDTIKYKKSYRYFLYAVLAYYPLDMLWGGLYVMGWLNWLYVVTEVYFVVMAAGIYLWTHFVVEYLGRNNVFGRLLLGIVRGLLVMVLVFMPLNRLWPVVFSFDADGIYRTGIARDIVFGVQVLLLLLIAGYTLYIAGSSSAKKKKRYFVIGLSDLLMFACVAAQIYLPTYPCYAVSYMLGCCLLRKFMVENERDEYRKSLEIALEREQEQFQELKKAWHLAYTDAMTGVKSKLAYRERRDALDKEIAAGTLRKMAVVVLDVNDLKIINDTCGHDVGDEYIKKACRLICGIFKKSPVYRVGGDEFVVLLTGDDYECREELKEKFNQEIEKNIQGKSVIVALGMAKYDAAEDSCFGELFDRADEQMYIRKRKLKKMTGRAENDAELLRIFQQSSIVKERNN